MFARLAITITVFLTLLVGGCASGTPNPASEPVVSVVAPAGLTVRAEVHVRDTITAQRFRSGVYLLEPDGTLRVAGFQRRTEGEPMPQEPVYPPILRRLSASEVDRVWRLIGPTSLADPDNPETILPAEDWSPPTRRSVALVEIRDQRGSRRFVVSLSGATPAAVDAQSLIERLQALAWRTPQPRPAEG